MNAFIALHKSVMKDDKVLALKYREMIALGIGIASRCDGCIAAHVAGALQAGASREELVATIDVAVLMGGGPSIIYGYLFTRTGLTASVLPGWDNLSSRCTP